MELHSYTLPFRVGSRVSRDSVWNLVTMVTPPSVRDEVLNTGAKLTHPFADFERFLAEIVTEIDDLELSRPKFPPNRPRKRLENRGKEVKTRKRVIKR